MTDLREVIKCHCGKPAEVKWHQPHTAKVPDSIHTLCRNCMSKIWGEIQLKFPTSESHAASRFEEINQ